MNLIQLINEDHFNCLLQKLNIMLYCLTKLKDQYLLRLPLILKSLMDVCLEKLEPTIVLFLRNIYLNEQGRVAYDFALIFLKIMTNKLKILSTKCVDILPFLVFKCLRLISVCQLHKDCAELQSECETVITYVHENHKKSNLNKKFKIATFNIKFQTFIHLVKNF